MHYELRILLGVCYTYLFTDNSQLFYTQVFLTMLSTKGMINVSGRWNVAHLSTEFTQSNECSS